ncbi:hypothetical protein HDU83_009814 [Entophlyctis luteolus]|nr:hypothetical protein HDU83_009814 [Entophlyctis luteolus]
MKRRLSLVLSNLGEHDVLLLDEPTTGLDIQNKEYIREFIISLKKEKIILVATHDLEEAKFLADRVGLLVDGCLVQCCDRKRNESAIADNLREISLSLVSSSKVLSLDIFRHYFLKSCPSAVLIDASTQALVFIVGGVCCSLDDELEAVVKCIQDDLDEFVLSWKISFPSLETMFRKTQNKEFQ